MYGNNYSLADIAAASGNNGGLFGGNNDWLAALFLLPFFGGAWGGGFGGFGGGGIGCLLPWLFMGNGFGGWGGNGNCATQADLAAGFNNSAVLGKLNDLTLGQTGIQQTMCQGFNGINTAVLEGFHGVDNAVCTLGYQTQQGFNGIERSMAGLGAQLAGCCCDIERSIDANTNAGLLNTMNLQKQISDCCCENEKMNLQSRFDAQTNHCGTLQAIDKLGDRIIGYMANADTQRLRDENQALRLSASQAAQNAYLIGQLRPSPIPSYRVPNPYCCNNNPCDCNSGW